MDGWMAGWMDGWIDARENESNSYYEQRGVLQSLYVGTCRASAGE